MRTYLRFALALALSSVAGWVAAQGAKPPAPLPISDAIRPANIVSMKISPDGKQVAALAHVGKHFLVALTDTETLAARVVVEPGVNWDVAPRAIGWAQPNLLWVNMGDYVWVMDAAGKDVRRIVGRHWGTLGPSKEGHERIVITASSLAGGLERANLRTGKVEHLSFDRPGRSFRSVVDSEGVPRVVSTLSTELGKRAETVTHWYRPSLNDKWQALATFPLRDVAWWPEMLTPDQQALVVSAREERDTWAMYRYSFEDRKIGELIAGHPTEDLALIDEDLGAHGYLRLVSHGMRRQTYWLDEAWAKLQKAVDAALPQHYNWLSGDSKGKVLIHSISDIEPGRWHLLDTRSMSMSEIGVARPQIDPAAMLPKRIVRYKAPDGLLIPAYLTLPREAAQGRVPAVVMIHNGPASRDSWAWDDEVQMLASRGYAVLQPQFRGSRGLGKRFEQAGYQQWGRAMQDDVTAGAQWLSAEGIADPKRMCIYGEGYGGYAALWALAKTPDLFQCGVSLGAVSDINYMFTDRANLNDPDSVKSIVYRQVGDPETMRDSFDEVSPVLHAARIKAPVRIVHAEWDGRVPLDHSRRMVAALRSHGKAHEYEVVMDEGMSGWRRKNLQHFYESLFGFLERHIGAPVATQASRSDLPGTDDAKSR
jgi:dienelactone hydrolase